MLTHIKQCTQEIWSKLFITRILTPISCLIDGRFLGVALQTRLDKSQSVNLSPLMTPIKVSWLSFYTHTKRYDLELGFRGMARRSHCRSEHKYRLVQVSFNLRARVLLQVLITATALHLLAGECSGTRLSQ
jgi:hypothetical protein